MDLVCISDYEQKALEILPKPYGDYFKSGAGDQWSLQNNLDSFKRISLIPKCLQDVSRMDLGTNLWGDQMKLPIGIAPTAYHKLGHADGEVATAKAAEQAGAIYTMSSLSSTSIEEVASAAPNAIKWLQLYIFKPRSFTERLIRKAKENGFKAFVLTVDSPTRPIIYSTFRNHFDTPDHIRAVNLVDPTDAPGMRPETDSSLTWDDVKWLVRIAELPVIAKGIMRREDAVKAVDAGCAAVWVSNHGGRLLDTTPAPIEVLEEIAAAVKGRINVFMDGGVRLGTDVFKALALGADMVFLGRPILWGLSVDGQAGVEKVLSLIKGELVNSMALCGVSHVQNINKEFILAKSLL